jgi:hypothetical protein
MPLDGDDGCLPNPEEVWRRVFDADTHWISCREMDPVERALNVRQSGLKMPDYIGIRCNSETDTVHHASETHIGTRW